MENNLLARLLIWGKDFTATSEKANWWQQKKAYTKNLDKKHVYRKSTIDRRGRSYMDDGYILKNDISSGMHTYILT